MSQWNFCIFEDAPTCHIDEFRRTFQRLMRPSMEDDLTDKLPASELLAADLLALLRQRQDELAAAAQARFRESVRPIYGAKLNGRPTHIGSAVLIEICSVKVLVTAAHIIDLNKLSTLYLGAGGSLSIIEGDFSVTEAPKGRNKDHYDFAFCRLSDELVKLLDGSHFITVAEMNLESPLSRGSLFTALGFPNSKNRKYNPKRLTVKPRLLPYSSVHVLDPEIAKTLPNEGADHIFMTYSKRSRDTDGNVVNSASPKGISGGLIIDAGRPADLEVLVGTRAPQPLLTGIVIELKKKKVLLGVRLTVIIPHLQKEFAKSLPAPS